MFNVMPKGKETKAMTSICMKGSGRSGFKIQTYEHINQLEVSLKPVETNLKCEKLLRNEDDFHLAQRWPITRNMVLAEVDSRFKKRTLINQPTNQYILISNMSTPR